MNEDNHLLYQQIQAYPMDQPNACLTFSKRLARENHWSKRYTERVIAEYKKFTFLAVTAGHKVTPSDQVDQAWHLHLINSRSYWDEFCPKILGKTLHHEPSRGGSVEQDKFIDWYQKTLDSYERLFGYLPPADIWPSTTKRFGHNLNFVRINKHQHWMIIPKPKGSLKIPSWQRMSILPLLFLLVVISGCAGVSPLLMGSSVTGGMFLGFNMFWFENLQTMDSAHFLTVYAVTGFVLLLIAMDLKERWLKSIAPTIPASRVHLSAEMLAYIAGGNHRVIHTALAGLIERGVVAISEDKRHIELIADSESQSIMEAEIIAAVSLQPQKISTLLRINCSVIKNSLAKQGLLIDKNQASQARIEILFIPLLLLGLIRCGVGASQSHPIGFLIFLMIIVFITALNMSVKVDEIIPYGKEVLANYANPKKTQTSLIYKVAVTGLSALNGTTFAEVRQILVTNEKSETKDGNSGSGCGGGGDGGGCGGGCGGCGGGCG